MRATFVLALLLGVSSALALAGPAGAQTFSISPVRITLATNQRSAVLHLGNPNAAPITVQVSAYHELLNGDGGKRLEPTDELLVYPQIVRIPPRAERLIRVGMLQPPDAEQSYRLILETPPLPPEAQPQGQRISAELIVRVSIPVTVQPADLSTRPR